MIKIHFLVDKCIYIHHHLLMKSTNIHPEPLLAIKIAITKDQKEEAKRLARRRRMTFSGFVGSLVEQELKNAEKESL